MPRIGPRLTPGQALAIRQEEGREARREEEKLDERKPVSLPGGRYEWKGGALYRDGVRCERHSKL